MFVRRQDFLAVGGFSSSTIIEEADLWERLRERGEIVLVRSFMGNSDRKWQRLGLVRTTWWHWKLCWQHQKDRYNKEVKERYEWVRRNYRENGTLS